MSEERLWETFEEPRRERAEKAEARVAELESTLTSIAATLYCADSAELVDEALRLANSVFEKPTASVCTDQEKDSGKSNAESTDCRSFEVSQGVEEAVRGARQSRGHGRDEPLESDRGMAQAAETDQVNARARSEESTEAVRVIAEAARERLRTSEVLRDCGMCDGPVPANEITWMGSRYCSLDCVNGAQDMHERAEQRTAEPVQPGDKVTYRGREHTVLSYPRGAEAFSVGDRVVIGEGIACTAPAGTHGEVDRIFASGELHVTFTGRYPGIVVPPEKLRRVSAQRPNEAKPTGLEVLKKWSEEGAADLQNMNDAHPRSETPLAWTPELYNEAFELGRNSSIEQAVNERFRALWNQTVGACVAALESADPPSAKLYAGLQYGADLLRKLAPETGSAGT